MILLDKSNKVDSVQSKSLYRRAKNKSYYKPQIQFALSFLEQILVEIQHLLLSVVELLGMLLVLLHQHFDEISHLFKFQRPYLARQKVLSVEKQQSIILLQKMLSVLFIIQSSYYLTLGS
jgi:hypothetical protein